MIELFEQDIKTNDRQSSKGNQLKWENNKPEADGTVLPHVYPAKLPHSQWACQWFCSRRRQFRVDW